MLLLTLVARRKGKKIMKITLPSINNLNTDHLLLYQFLFACKPISGKLFARRSSFPTHTLAGFSANGVLKRMLSMILCSESVFKHSCACAYVFVCVCVLLHLLICVSIYCNGFLCNQQAACNLLILK